MNKLGFYIEVSTVRWMREALSQIKPPVILFHAGDRGLLREIRERLSPESLIIARWMLTQQEQEAALDGPDPEAAGRDLAKRILNYDSGYATEEWAGRRLVDAWMSLNEFPGGPASWGSGPASAEFIRRAAAYDRFQVAFRQQLQTEKIEAVAFNFAAGNYTKPEHYLEWFPKTLAAYKYFGFHEYGWPSLIANDPAGAESSATFYRRCMEAIRQKYGDDKKAIITEAGLTRQYKYRNLPLDVGWLSPPDLTSTESVTEEAYWRSLRWYNEELCQDDYVLGACLFQIGHGGRWVTFRHLSQDNDPVDIQIIAKIAKLRESAPSPSPTPPPSPTPTPSPTPPPTDLVALRQRISSHKESLAQWRKQVATATELNQQLQAQLSAIDSQVKQAPDLNQKAAANRQRIANIRAKAITHPSAQPAIARRLDGLDRRIDAALASMSKVSALAAELKQAQVALKSWQKNSQNLTNLLSKITTLQQQLADLEKEAGGVAPDGPIVLLNPMPGKRITQFFGKRPDFYKEFGLAGHEGIDFGCSIGTPVLAAADGGVFGKGDVKNGYGLRIILKHTWGGQTAYTIYAHLSELDPLLHTQNTVKAGQVIGKSGKTGNSDGPHLHFSLLFMTENPGYPARSLKAWFYDPWPYLQKDTIASAPAWPPEEEEEGQCMPFDFGTIEI